MLVVPREGVRFASVAYYASPVPPGRPRHDQGVGVGVGMGTGQHHRSLRGVPTLPAQPRKETSRGMPRRASRRPRMHHPENSARRRRRRRRATDEAATTAEGEGDPTA